MTHTKRIMNHESARWMKTPFWRQLWHICALWYWVQGEHWALSWPPYAGGSPASGPPEGFTCTWYARGSPVRPPGRGSCRGPTGFLGWCSTAERRCARGAEASPEGALDAKKTTLPVHPKRDLASVELERKLVPVEQKRRSLVWADPNDSVGGLDWKSITFSHCCGVTEHDEKLTVSLQGLKVRAPKAAGADGVQAGTWSMKSLRCTKGFIVPLTVSL